MNQLLLDSALFGINANRQADLGQLQVMPLRVYQTS